jgi:CBS domain-containing protein
MFDTQWQNRLLQIAACQHLEQLKSIRTAEQNTLESDLCDEAHQLVNRLNELHDAIIRKAVKLAENDLARQGRGAPPVPYAYLLLGSGGRSEQTMHSDQDSGLVYADSQDEAAAERCRSYFNELAEKVVEDLVFLGYPRCEGNVLASNPEWCQPLNGWKHRLDGWFAEPNWENVRYLLIAADARVLTGDAELAAKLQDHFFHELVNHPSVAGRMLENTLHHKVLVGFFGQLLPERYGTEAGSVDIKYGAYIPMVNAFRLLAVRAGIRDTATIDRIQQLKEAGVLNAEEAQEAAEAFSFVLKMRMIGKIMPSQLTKEVTASLKKALKAGRKWQSKLQREMKDRFGGR